MKKAVVPGRYYYTVIVIGSLITLMACSSSTPTTDDQVPDDTGESVTINITAENIAFDKSTITVPAGANVTVVFDNKDRVPHNLAVYETTAATKEIFVGEIFTGPGTIEYRFTAPSTPGTYFFRCDVHPSTMTGDFIVTTVDS